TFGRKTGSIAADIFGPRRAGQPGCRKTTNFTGREVTTNRGRIKTKAIPVFVGIGLVLSACSANTDYGPPSYAYFNPIRGSSNPDFGYWDGWRGQSVSGFSDGQFGGHVPPPYWRRPDPGIAPSSKWIRSGPYEKRLVQPPALAEVGIKG